MHIAKLIKQLSRYATEIVLHERDYNELMSYMLEMAKTFGSNEPEHTFYTGVVTLYGVKITKTK